MREEGKILLFYIFWFDFCLKRGKSVRHNGKLNGALSGGVLTLLVLVFLYALFVSVRDLHCTFVSKKIN